MSFSSEIEFKNSKPLTDAQFNEMVRLADTVREVDDETFAMVVTRQLQQDSEESTAGQCARRNDRRSGLEVDRRRNTVGERMPKDHLQRTYETVQRLHPRNPKDEFVTLGAANVGSASPKTVVFGVVKDTMEIIRVRNSAGDVLAEDFSIENGYLDGRAFGIELPTNVTGELTIEGYSYDDDVADSLPETKFLPTDAKPLATESVTVK